MPVPSAEELTERKRIQINAETVGNAASTDFPGHWPGENHEWDLEYFKENFKVQFHTSSPLDLSFSLIGIDTSVANAFRRILLAEIPTLAIEDVYIYQNTSIIQDEVLAHRLGLIPLRGNHAALDWMKWYKKPTTDTEGSGSPSDYNTVTLMLHVRCEWQDGGLDRAAAGETDPDKLYTGHTVFASDMMWSPIGQQEALFGPDGGVEAQNPGIVIAKMRPGQEIKLMMHAFKGIGQDHAKFSPVATASYRLLPTIDISKPIVGPDAKKFARCFPKGVIALETVTEKDAGQNSELEGKQGELKAVVADPMRDTVSRECLRHPEFKDKVKLGRVRDHFIFRIESTGQYDSDHLFLESVKLLKVKCARIKRGLAQMTQ
ncbi:DNA-directed RNA polymeras-like proteines I and III subunit RPAC1 [Melanomma pulvis-pyrius CBS 109.77]|uniref:DNA-directed RNA polymerases I and III subunit RPAC1 n=1 Tax=Melanomma pulvis-pyrius CBS 109.77 TaxID=1314802 RepID=A0A6A6XNZ0_9PLEO|nr:DNA-directed RNA polymeras-like proteines I and III subunit RPAC1 [Melanomma pulvis-pyrius CBS 109.77]